MTPLKISEANSRRGWGLPIVPAERRLAAELHQTGVAGTLCALILGCFLIAGLWPFRQIRNDVAWIANQPGVHFGKHGIILSADALPAGGSGDCSIEMWVRPVGGEDFSTLLAFDGPSGGTGLSLHRSLTDLRLDRATSSGKLIKSYVDKVLHDGKLVFLTVVSGSGGISVFQNGVLAGRVSPVRAAGDCTGSFGVGHHVRGHNSWQGDILGLAIYSRALAPDQVLRSYQSWRIVGRPDERSNGRPEALYLFDEKGGAVVRDSGASGAVLIIPEKYQNIQRTWLQSPLGAFEFRWGYVEDIVINIGGFIPFGFVLSAFLVSVGRVRKVAEWAILGGLFVSLTIEILQVYLPTRSSDLTDVLTNTLGTCLGAIIYAIWQHRLSDG